MKTEQSKLAGVTIDRPETCVIDPEVEVAPGTVIEPFVQLLGATKVGKECRIRSYSVLEDTTLGNRVLVRHGCIVSQSRVDDGVLLGPYAHVRPESEIGEGVNVGAGAITCNYDGVSKRKTVIGDHVFVGSNSTLVAPLTLGNGAYIAAGSCITEDVPEDALALGRARQTITEGWSAARRNKKQG